MKRAPGIAFVRIGEDERVAMRRPVLDLRPRRLKYGNRKTPYNGQTYDSAKEARRAAELDLLIRVGQVTRYRRQPRFALFVNGIYVGRYTADFEVHYPDDRTEIEDVKGPYRDDAYQLRRKLFEALYGQIVKEPHVR